MPALPAGKSKNMLGPTIIVSGRESTRGWAEQEKKGIVSGETTVLIWRFRRLGKSREG